VRLVEFLDQHPLRARKSHEYVVWREAVALWAARKYGLEPGSRARLGRLAELIKIARIYRDPHPDTALPVLTDGYAQDYFTGFFSGEGCFRLEARSARFVIRVRRDDRPLLDAFCRDFRIGSVCDVERTDPGSPVAVWHVTALRAVLRGIEMFETAGLLGRKERQFRAWQPGAEALARAKIAGEPVDDGLVEQARRRLRQVTAYSAPPDGTARDDARAVARDAYAEVLRAWAAVADGPLSCTAYERFRRPLRSDWPKRDTIAAAYGGWRKALAAAGLEERAVSS
jgi:hypothetical protein